MAAPATIGYTDIATVQAGGANTLASLLDPNFSSGRLKAIVATYTITGNEAANDAVYIARVPKGALISPTNGSIATVGGTAGTTLTCSIGDTDTKGATGSYDPARYSAAVNVQAQTTTTPVAFSGGTELITNAPPQEIGDDWCWLLATFATVSTLTAGRKLVFRIQGTFLD
jgi:hypothetical protein